MARKELQGSKSKAARAEVDASTDLLRLVSLLVPVVGGGNAVVALATADASLSALALAEVLATSDLPGGVINLLTGRRDKLLPHFASHRDLDDR